jgi:cytochrome c oxidase subunit 2
MKRLKSSMMFAGLAATAYTTQSPSTPTEASKEFRLTARKYGFSPDKIRVKQGDHVKLIITAIDVDHGFKLEAFHITRTLPKGEPVIVEFTAEQPGAFPFESRTSVAWDIEG